MREATYELGIGPCLGRPRLQRREPPTTSTGHFCFGVLEGLLPRVLRCPRRCFEGRCPRVAARGDPMTHAMGSSCAPTTTEPLTEGS